MKTYVDFLMEGVEGYTFREVVDNIDADQFEDAAEAYHQYKTKLSKESNIVGHHIHYDLKGHHKIVTIIYNIGGAYEASEVMVHLMTVSGLRRFLLLMGKELSLDERDKILQ
ncbi:MAG: hypothetical protein WAT79_08680 [Saprospiraceae bacterium]